jgi:hypothetical protein
MSDSFWTAIFIPILERPLMIVLVIEVLLRKLELEHD